MRSSRKQFFLKAHEGVRGQIRLRMHLRSGAQPPVAQQVASSVSLDCLKESREAQGEVTHTLEHRYVQKEAATGDLNAPCDECVPPPSQEHRCRDVPCLHTCC